MLKRSLPNIIKNQHGMLSIEFAGAFIGFMLIIFLLYDFYNILATQGRLDRATYSVASIFRERSHFYVGVDVDGLGDELIDQAQAAQIATLLAASVGESSLEVKVDLYKKTPWSIIGGSSSSNGIDERSYCAQAGCSNSFFNHLPSMASLASKVSPLIEEYDEGTIIHWKRFSTLYRISACINRSESLLQKAINMVSSKGTLCSTSIVVSRCDRRKNQCYKAK